jgi:nitroimidazol reductase NimA-like FMN-containing flavoprotein (pyridoxamine 5'-phosphate oxidase superfamily)
MMALTEMSLPECVNIIARAQLVRLACAKQNQPYVVPTFLTYHDPFLYGFAAPGQKIDWMRANPQVCIEFDEVRRFDDWTCVIVFGRYEDLSDSSESEEERRQAHELLRRNMHWWQPAAASTHLQGPPVPFQPVYYRIRIEQITGRRASPDIDKRS